MCLTESFDKLAIFVNVTIEDSISLTKAYASQ